MDYSTINLNDLIGLDFETYGAVSLPDHGLERYVSDSSFTPLIACTTRYKDGARVRQRYVLWNQADVNLLMGRLAGRWVCAHNAGFEERVNRWFEEHGLGMPSPKGYIDSAVIARAMGAAGKLEAAAPQLLDTDKLEDGWRLIKLFSIPSAEQLEDGDREFDPNLIVKHAQDWELFFVYCGIDADLSLELVVKALMSGWCSDLEVEYNRVTMEMNQLGWHVDVDTVEEMYRRYQENQAKALDEFRTLYDPLDETLDPVAAAAKQLNLNSLPQLKKWCADRGIKANSFDEKHVAKLLERINTKLDTMLETDSKYEGYAQVEALLRTKQILGGSSLKKLKVVLNTTSEDGRLRDQYMHIGAGQTWRTTGRSVQMQNLKRLGGEPDNMLELQDMDSEWDNEKLALNLRQVFTATHPQGRLIVGDFASVESRGLAWWANAHWKLDAYREGKDMYKVLAADMFNVHYDDVLKPQRQTGKVGELSCGYQAGGPAVQAFASNMGVQFTEAEAAALVADWRATNPEIVAWWGLLDEALRQGFNHQTYIITSGYNFTIEVTHVETPASLLRQHPKGAQSLAVIVRRADGSEFMRRIFHGVYERGRSLCYYKPSERKTGDLWSNHFTDPKTKQVKFYNIYGGKLAGILTQSLCRQMFFASLLEVHKWCSGYDNLELIGQFHDEIVLDWAPASRSPHLDIDLTAAEYGLKQLMSRTELKGFPLAADVKSDYRYTK